MVRWWWFGTSNTKEDVDQQLDAMVTAGIGGVELSFVYPVAQAQSTTFRSPEFLEIVRYTSEGARRRGMRFDFTIGSGWSFGGAHVTEAHAAKRLWFEDRAIGSSAQRLSLPGRWPGDKLIAAWVCDGAMGEQTDDYRPLEIEGDVVIVPAGAYPRTLLLATSGGTTQQLKRASKGAEGPTLDHYCREATLHHLEAVGKPFLDAVGAANVTSVFCDSLEVYNSNWTPTFVEEFTRRRGYDPVPFLYHIETQKTEGAEFRADFYNTLSDIYEDNFLVTCRDWARQHGTKFRIQNYGHPPARVSSYRHADMIEGEQWGWRKIPQSKWASSAAHHLGVQVVSSETWTHINLPAFNARPLDFKAEAHDQILCGINQFIGHGWPSSPTDIVSPGWSFYAAGALTDRNEWWEAASQPLLSYLHRLSEVMRQGEPVAHVGLWLPYEDTYANFTPAEELNLWKASARRLGEEIPLALRQAGYDFDVIDAGTSTESVVRRHQLVVLAGSTMLSKADVAQLERLAAAGIKLIVVDSDILPDATHVSQDGVLRAVKDVVSPDTPTGTPGVGAVHRQLANGELYFVANTDPESRLFHLQPRISFKSWERWDLRTGSVVQGTGDMRAELAAYGATIYITSPATPHPSHEISTRFASAVDPASSTRLSLNKWVFHGPEGEEQIEAPHAWKENNFAGTLHYTTTVDLNSEGQLPIHLVLDTSHMPTPERNVPRQQCFQAHSADPVGVVAAVLVNGEHAGVFWDPPYEVPVGHLLQQGDNSIELRVSSTSAHHMRSPEWLKIWTDAEETHGRRFIMQAIDKVFEPTRSGLLVVPELR